jgi:hypothetical protein
MHLPVHMYMGQYHGTVCLNVIMDQSHVTVCLKCYRWQFTRHMYLGFYWLAMANSCVNPFIYYWMNKR